MNNALTMISIHETTRELKRGRMKERLMVSVRLMLGSRQSGRKRTNSGDHESGRNQQLPDDAGKVCRSVTARCCNLAQDREDIQLVTRKCAKAMASPTAEGPRKTEALGEVSGAQAAPGR